ncbi:hypothetical protein BHM03_00007241 [Ensete ventricosum]|uniref:Uncharacterized protein n=1 Tax=Ensete ventricosum TaxID=4639 RepID=A0A445MC13_ENSVE|nr:hypothetical protein BHM03_00007241 [Ensete ventricosum]
MLLFSWYATQIVEQIVRLLANHPHFGITLMTADRKAGQSIGSVFPHLITQKEAVYGLTEVLRGEIQNARLVANPGFVVLLNGLFIQVMLFFITQIDNLVKGASGQALQNLNLMMGFPEDTGLQYQPLFP